MRFRKLFTPVVHRLRRIPERSRLPFALGLVIAIALLLTTVSVSIYSFGGFSKLDLSRPGFERERSEVRQTETQKSYNTSGPVTRGAIDEFLKEYDQRATSLKEYGDFRDQALDDASLQLSN